MKKTYGLIFIAIVTIVILIGVFRPGVFEEIWLWLVGLAGSIIGFIRYIANSISPDPNSPSPSTKPIPQASPPSNGINSEELTSLKEENLTHRNEIINLKKRIKELEKEMADSSTIDNFSGTTLTVLRYVDDGETTLGLLFIDNEFFSYTLEDTYREVKIYEQTRIPSGTYSLGFREEATPLTLKYRKTRPWFNYHIEIQHVENYTGVYIHNGSTHEHTAGCLLVADGIYSGDDKKFIHNSRVTFERLYKKIGALLNAEKSVRIKIFDEEWFTKSKI